MAILSPYENTNDLGNGAFSSEISISPKYYNSGGVWKSIDNMLKNSGDPTLTIGASGIFDFRIRNKLTGNAPLLHIGRDNTTIKLTPLGTNNVDGIISSNSIIFPNAWNNCDLKYTVESHIIRKEIILRSGHPSSFSFSVYEKIGDLDDDLIGSNFRMISPYLNHPSFARGMGSHSYYMDRPCEIVKSTQGGKRIYTINLPLGDWGGWILDPTFTSQPNGASGIDTFIDSSAPTTNSGANQSMYVDNFDDTYTTYIAKALIKFDISSIPSGSTITSAIMGVYKQNPTVISYTMNIFRVLRNWGESTATWNKYDSTNAWGTAGCENTTSDRESLSVASLVLPLSVGFANFTLSSAKIQEMITGGIFTNNGFIIKNMSAATGESNPFATSDNTTSANRPKITINYTLGGGTSINNYSVMNHRRMMEA